MSSEKSMRPIQKVNQVDLNFWFDPDRPSEKEGWAISGSFELTSDGVEIRELCFKPSTVIATETGTFRPRQPNEPPRGLTRTDLRVVRFTQLKAAIAGVFEADTQRLQARVDEIDRVLAASPSGSDDAIRLRGTRERLVRTLEVWRARDTDARRTRPPRSGARRQEDQRPLWAEDWLKAIEEVGPYGARKHLAEKVWFLSRDGANKRIQILDREGWINGTRAAHSSPGPRLVEHREMGA